MHLGHPRRRYGTQRPGERALVLGGEADDHVGREVEVVETLDPLAELPDRVAAPHRAEDGVVAGLERDVEMRRHVRRLAHGGDQLGRDVVHLDRREPQPLEPVDRARRVNEAGEREPQLAIAEAPEIDTREDDLAVSLGDAASDLAQNGRRRAAPRAAADERDHAKRARERAAVLDLHERAHAVEPVVGLHAADRADIACDRLGDLLAATSDHADVGGKTREGVARRGWRRSR